MAIYLALLAIGFLVIFKGADWFVGAAVAIADGFHIPKVIIGATIVSVATVAPELFVSLIAAAMGRTELAMGNAVGSPINNIGLIFALCVCWSFIPVSGRILKRESAMMVGSALLLLALGLYGALTRPAAAFLLALTGGYVYYSWRRAITARDDWRRENRGDISAFPLRRHALMFLLGITMVLTGSRLLVFSGSGIARMLGVPETVIGLTLVALGTSLPEFFTAMTAMARGHKEISAGNIIGANILDIILVLGAAGLVRPMTFDQQTRLLAIPTLLLLTACFVFFGSTQKGFQRWEGALLLAVFAAYLVLLFLG